MSLCYCGNVTAARGLCRKHYAQVRRGEGPLPDRRPFQPNPTTPEHRSALSRIMDAVGRGECWPNQPTMNRRSVNA